MKRSPLNLTGLSISGAMCVALLMVGCNKNPSSRLTPIDLKTYDVAGARINAKVIEKSLMETRGVTAVSVSKDADMVTVAFEPSVLPETQLKNKFGAFNLSAKLHVFPEVKGGGKCPIPHQLFDPSSWF